MVKDLGLDQPLTNGRSEQGLKARAGVEVVVKHEKPHSDRRFQVRAALRHASEYMRSRAQSNQCAP